MNGALIGYPLSRDYKHRFEESVGGSPRYVALPELRRLPPVEMLKTLRDLDCEVLYLPLEDANSAALLPILQCVAAVSSARAVEIVRPDLSRERVSRVGALRSLVSLLTASLGGRWAAWRSRRELARLNAAERIPLRRVGAGRSLYLKTNLWFGVKAGGSIGHISGVVNALGDLGHDVDYLSAEEPVGLRDAATYRRIAPPTSFGLPYELNYYRFSRDFAKQASPHVRPGEHAFIYQRLSVANYTGVPLSRSSGLPLVIEYNGSEVWIARNWGRPLRYDDLAQAAEDACLRHAHLVVTVSDALRDDLVRRGVEPRRIVTYPNCIDPTTFDPNAYSRRERAELRAGHRIPEDAVVATFVGTFGEWHGVEILAEAIRKMVDEDEAWVRGRRLHFILVGDGLKMPQVRETLRGSRYAPYVTLTGLVPQESAPAYLAASDILLSPHSANSDGSRFFGSPTKLFEYMAMGKAIVASDLEQIGEVLARSLRVGELPDVQPDKGEDRLSVLTPPGDVDALIEGIRFLVERPEWRSALGENARAEALERYTWERHVRAILDGLHAASAEEGSEEP